MMQKKYGTTRLAKARKAAGYTQTTAAHALGLRGKSAVYDIESGAVHATDEQVKAMAALYGVELWAMLRMVTAAYRVGRAMTLHRKREQSLRWAKK